MSFPGAREISSISGSLPDDPGGITCMLKSRYPDSPVPVSIRSIYLLILPTPLWAFSASDCASGCEKREKIKE